MFVNMFCDFAYEIMIIYPFGTICYKSSLMCGTMNEYNPWAIKLKKGLITPKNAGATKLLGII